MYISAVLSWVWHLVQMRSDRRFVFLVGKDQNGIRATRGDSISSR